MCNLGAHCNNYAVVSSTNICGVSCVEIQVIPLYVVANVSCPQTAEAFPSGPCTVSTFRLLFAMSMIPLCGLPCSLIRHSRHLITFGGKLAGCTLDRSSV